MKIVALKEVNPQEKRVAITPDSAKRYKALGYDVVIEKGAGSAAGYADAQYKDVGAVVAASASAALKDATVFMHVAPLLDKQIKALPKGVVTIGQLDPYRNEGALKALQAQKASAVAVELVPRITRAQSMDVLSSQANLAGYRAVIDAVYEYGRSFPMMMTAAGTVAPAKVFVMGAGVAGLQAIATAKRLGAVVSATDVRLAAKEQVESLGASFVMVEDDEVKQAETSGGYAKEMSEAYKKKQAALIAETLKKQDIVITTALIPGRPAPVLVTEDMVKSMKPGAVIVDLAVANGGNCPLSQADKVVEKHGVTIVGYTNMPSRLAQEASSLYARNLYNLVSTLFSLDDKNLKIAWDDDILKGCVLLKDGTVIHPNFDKAETKKAAPKKKAPVKKKTSAAKKTAATKTKRKES